MHCALPIAPATTLTLVSESDTASDASASDRETACVGDVPSGAQPRANHDVPLDDTERYEMRSSLGAGGMGEVRECRDRRIGRDVALKMLRRVHYSRPDLRDRFLREAMVQGQLEHPAIVPVYDLSRDAQGNEFFTMKRVRGMTLEAILSRLALGEPDVAKQYSLRRLLTAFASVSLAVHFAHTRGVLHRDLKPSNIMLGGFGEVYVLDWGLAKVKDVHGQLAPDESGPIELDRVHDLETRAGDVMGTAGYMAPEQLTGGASPPTPAADIYALGAILFEIVMRQPLHEGTTVRELWTSTTRGAETRAEARGRADVDPELEALWTKATAMDPAERFTTARELSEGIERFLDGDRDNERRRELAAEHVRVASAAAQRALSDPQANTLDRQLAMHELNRAIALDPANAEALRTLAKLIAEPPPLVPPMVEAEIAREEDEELRTHLRRAAGLYASVVAFCPVAIVVGIRDQLQFAAIVALFLLTSASCFILARRAVPWALPIPFLLSSLGIISTAGIGSPLSPVTIGAAMINTIAYLMVVGHRRMLGVVVAVVGCISMVGPFVVDQLVSPHPLVEWHSRSAVVLHASTVDFTPLSPWAITLTCALLIVLGATFALGFRRQLAEARRRIHVQAWQLRQLVPVAARAESPSPANPWPAETANVA